MTAIQNWLTPPVDAVKALVCDALRSVTTNEPTQVAEPTLIRPGVERC